MPTEMATDRRSWWTLALVAYTFWVVMAGTTLPTPLYPLYQAELRFGSLTTTVIYAVYAVGVIATLLMAGRSSDALGRRPLLAGAVVLSMASAAVFLCGTGLAVLTVGRIVSGFSAGLVTSTATVALVELADKAHRARATLVATAVNMLGLGCGPLLSGLLAEYAPHPLRLPFLIDLVLLLPAAFAVWRTPETVAVARPAQPWRELTRWQRPAVPARIRFVFIPASLATFAAFSVFGLLTAIEPGLLAALFGQSDRALAGAVVFSMFAGSALGQLGSARLATRVALPAGCVVLVAGLAAIAAALGTRSLALLAVGTVVVGLGQGVCFRSGMAAITLHSPDDHRAEVVSAFLCVAYLGISLPVVLVGVAVAIVGLYHAAVAFTAVVAAVAVAAMVAILRLGRRLSPA
ncbi:MAG: MFS transporter [Kutzneria sp.]|nr:MFS transporter [Kutzneria sp.]MBV9844821.1 MFS transporter [Kutzneria sp.]